MRRALAVVLLAISTACKPPAVEAVDAWYTAFEQGDVERTAALTYSADRALVREALAELGRVATGTLASALPAKPISHKLIEVETKSDDGTRWVVLVETKLKNPLPFASERVGHVLKDMPKTREQKRRVLVVREGETWGVKLDLQRTVDRAIFVAQFQRALDAKNFAHAEELLTKTPAPPDEGNAQKKSDRLVDTLKAELEKAKKRAG